MKLTELETKYETHHLSVKMDRVVITSTADDIRDEDVISVHRSLAAAEKSCKKNNGRLVLWDSYLGHNGGFRA